MWHIHSKRLSLCWSSADTQQWHIHHTERKKKERMSSIVDRQHISHFICPSAVAHHWEREIVNCHISSLINENMKTVLSSVDGSGIYQHALCVESPGAPGPVKGQTAAVGCGAGDSQADSDLLQPSHESASRSSCLTLSKMTAGFQQAELFVTKQIVTNLWDKYRIARPPCFNLSFFCLLFR